MKYNTRLECMFAECWDGIARQYVLCICHILILLMQMQQQCGYKPKSLVPLNLQLPTHPEPLQHFHSANFHSICWQQQLITNHPLVAHNSPRLFCLNSFESFLDLTDQKWSILTWFIMMTLCGPCRLKVWGPWLSSSPCPSVSVVSRLSPSP